MKRTPIELPYAGLKGLSDKLIDQHFNVLYKGYVNKLMEIEEKLEKTDLEQANTTYSEVRELQRERVFTANAIRLHEGYFMSLGGNGGTPTGPASTILEQDFGSFENWAKQFKASAMSGRGWVIMAYDYNDKKVHNYMTDIHSDAVWSCLPILILDVYEHAYFMDYGANRKDYIVSFFGNINWDYVNSVIESNNIIEIRMAA